MKKTKQATRQKIIGRVSVAVILLMTGYIGIRLLQDSHAATATDTTTGQVIHYTFDNYGSGTVSDSSGGGNDGRLVNFANPPVTDPGATGSGKALRFNRSLKQRIDVGDGTTSPQAALKLNKFTIASWIKITENDTTEENWEVAEKAASYWLNVRNGNDSTANGASAKDPHYTLRCGGYFGGTYLYLDSDTTVPHGASAAWTHVACTYDGARLTLYINGVAHGSMAVTGTTATNNFPLAVGGNNKPNATPTDPFHNWVQGDMDEFYLFNRALTAGDVASLAGTVVAPPPLPPPPPSGALLDYNMEGISGSSLPDVSGSGNNAALLNFPAAPPTAAGPNGSGKALVFNRASQQYARLDYKAALNLSKYTIMSWVKPTLSTSPDDRWTVLGRGESYELNIRTGMGKNEAGKLGIVRAGGHYGGCSLSNWVILDSSSALPAGQWSHVASTYDGQQVKVYINGVLKGTAAASGAPCADGDWLGVGVHHQQFSATPEPNSGFYDGALDSVRLYGSALTATEIAAAANNSVAPPPPPPPVTPPPVQPPPPPPTGNGDANNDGRVNALDLSILLSHDGANYAAADFNGDGSVGAADMAILLGKWTW